MVERSDLWCGRHWETIKHDAAPATVKLTTLVVSHPAFISACGGCDIGECDDAVIDVAMHTLAPLCCLYPDAVIEMIAQMNTDDMVKRLVRAAARGAL